MHSSFCGCHIGCSVSTTGLLSADRAPFRELYSNQTPRHRLLGHEVACSPQSSRCMTESDRPLKWCVRPSFCPAASAIMSGCTAARCHPLFMQLHIDIHRTQQEDNKPLLPHRETKRDKETEGKEEEWTEGEREGKNRVNVCCVILHRLFSAGLPPSLVSLCKLSHRKIKQDQKREREKKLHLDTNTSTGG